METRENFSERARMILTVTGYEFLYGQNVSVCYLYINILCLVKQGQN